MRFDEVLPLFKQGEKVKREAWKNWAIRLEDGKAVVMRNHYRDYWEYTQGKIDEFTMKEILAEDWKVVG